MQSEQKRRSSRAIIFKSGQMVSMYRERDGRKFYTFPGGGIEDGETEEQAVIREVFEEFGLTVEPIKKVYIYEGERSIEHFFVCKWLKGRLGDGAGEEFEADRNRGLYVQTAIDIKNIPNLPLMPPEVASALIKDYKKNGEALRSRTLKIYSK